MLIFLMYMFAVLGVGLLLTAALLQYRLSLPPVNGQQLSAVLSTFNLKFPQQFVTPDQSHIIALDEDGQTMAIGRCAPGLEADATAALYTFDTILGSEIVENALTLTKVSKSSRTSSAIRPAAGIGISVKAGSTAADTGQSEEIKELTLKIYLSSDETPVLSIPFLPGLTPAKKSDLQYSQAFSEAQHVHEKLREIVSASA